MERPTWATIAGILAIVFGSFGLLGGAQEMVMPYMLDMQKDVMHGMNEMIQQSQQNNLQGNPDAAIKGSPAFNPFELLGLLDEKMEIPDWYRSYAPLSGGISILISAVYLLSGIFLLMLKPFAPLLFKITLGVSVLWGVTSTVVYAMSGNVLLIMSIPGSVSGIAIDIVLLVVVFVGSKEAFRQKASQAELPG